MEFSGCPDDSSFGPTVHICRDSFDFTLQFEKIFFSIIPSSVFLAVSLSRCIWLVREPVIVQGLVLRYIKAGLLLIYAALQLSLLILGSTAVARLTYFFVPSAALDFLAALSMIALSWLEHSRSPRPSILLNGYLILTLLFDIAQCRSLGLSAVTHVDQTFARVFTAATAVKALVIVPESWQKTRWILWDVKEHSPEEMSGIYSLGAFFWLRMLFKTGNKKLLTLDDLFPLDQSMASEILAKRLGDHLEAHPTGGKPLGLLSAVAKVLIVPLLLPVPPRLAFSGFRFAQPFLIKSVLSYLEQPASESRKNAGYGLIGATILIYMGISISTSFYQYFQQRALWMTRGALASIIYKKTTESRLSATDDSAALTLMSTDIERIVFGFRSMHDLWVTIIEVSIASWLLYTEIGAAFVATIVVVLVCMTCIMGVMNYSGKSQKAWMERIQKRVGMTSSTISNMKHLKISGLTAPMEAIIQQLRVDEIRVGSNFRKILIIAVTVSFAPSMLSPALTFAFAGGAMNVTKIFTSISLLVLLTEPLSQVFQFVPTLLAGVTCFKRIQTFLEKDPRKDFRESSLAQMPEKKHDESAGESTRGKPTPAITVAGGSFGWEEDRIILKKLDLSILTSNLTIVVGPVASGKSTLCNVLLGETPAFGGRVALTHASRKIGYCNQVPFLSNATIRENIVGYSEFDSARYNDVVEATMLLPDFAVLPRGDRTKVGSNGITLSGGQKQRVSMARALYLQSDILVFDDILSGLDADTEEHVFQRVFGPDGIMRRQNATAILCTHAVRHLPSADHIIALGPDGSLVEQGTFEELMANKKYVHSLGVEVSHPPSGSTTPITPAQRIAPTAEAEEPSLFRTQSAASENSSHVEDSNRQVGDSTVYKHYAKAIGWPILSTFMLSAIAFGFFVNFPQVWLSYWSADTVSPNREHPNAYWVGLYALLQILCLVSLIVCCVFGFFFVVAQSGSALHREALRTVMAAPLRFFTKTDAGVVTNLFSQDMTLIDSELPQALLNITVQIFSVVGMAAIVATSSPYITISYPFLLAVLWLIQRYYLRTSRQLRLLDLEAKSPLYTHFTDTLNGVATLRAFDWVEDSIYLNTRLLDNSQRPAYLLSMIQRCLTFVLNMIVAVLATLVVVLATQLKSTTGTGFTGASMVTLMEFGTNLAHTIQMYTLLETSIGAVSRLKSFSEMVTPETLPGEDMVPPLSWPSGGAIEIKRVSASYVASEEQAKAKEDSSEVALVLKNLDLKINSGEKVAICGRSGSGKSSIILLLLRLLDPLPYCAENMTIDGVLLHRVDRSTLRQRIIAVSQDAVFLPDGTSIRKNLDPFQGSTDDECRTALQAVDLWNFAEEHGGLSAGMSADTLSQGQKQLFSLARAVLRRRIRSRQYAATSAGVPLLVHEKKGEEARAAMTPPVQGGSAAGGGILLLDEVSSSVDVDTDRTMQALIKREFASYTIVMVSHRLDMVMDFDRVLIMDDGRAIESGSPRELVEQEGSRFRELWAVGRHQAGRESRLSGHTASALP